MVVVNYTDLDLWPNWGQWKHKEKGPGFWYALRRRKNHVAPQSTVLNAVHVPQESQGLGKPMRLRSLHLA